MAKPRAVVFDLEGTLVDDVRFQFEAWNGLAQKIGAVMNQSVFHSFNGMKDDDVFRRLLGREIGPSLAEALGRQKNEHYRTLLEPQLAPMSGASELLSRLRGAGVKLALVTTSAPEIRALILGGLAWNDAFDVVVDDEGMPGKPEPDLYLAAAKALGVTPGECLAVEDNWNGVTAAAGAGMTVVGITTNVDAAVLERAGATRTIASFDELPAIDTLL